MQTQNVSAHETLIIKKALDFMKSIDVHLDSYESSVERTSHFPIYVDFRKPQAKHRWQVNLYADHSTCNFFRIFEDE